MAQIIQQQTAHVNSQLTNVTGLATLNNLPLKLKNKKAKSTRPKKLHSADIAYLKILAWFHTIGKQCYLSKAQWPEWLKKFGGKQNHYRVQKTRWGKMRALGYIFMSYQNGNRNIQMRHSITDLGLKALQEWEIKNSPSKIGKRYPETKKTAPPLKIRIRSYENHENDVFEYPKTYPKTPPIQHPIIDQLKEFGLYEPLARKLFLEKGEKQIKYAIDITKKRNVKTPGAYISRILINPIFDSREYGLEEKSEAEKQEFAFDSAGRFSQLMGQLKNQEARP